MTIWAVKNSERDRVGECMEIMQDAKMEEVEYLIIQLSVLKVNKVSEIIENLINKTEINIKGEKAENGVPEKDKDSQ